MKPIDDLFAVVTMWSPALGDDFTLTIHSSYPIDLIRKNGAGEGIRTLDPNLGKVVLYH